jgi:circadian clock protein KaiC
MNDRLLSGHPQLDDVLGGGLPAHAITLVMGAPGSGKTILAQQYAFRNGRPESPTVYFSTVSEPLEKIVRFGQSLNFFDTAAIGDSVFYEDLGATVSRDGLEGVAEQIGRAILERRPALIVIDSFKALQAFAADYRDFRRFLHEVAGRLGASPTASLWVGEYVEDEIPSMAEFAVADAIIELRSDRVGQREARFLQVKKLRGSGFRSGQHAYRLTPNGLHLFPRLADTQTELGYTMGDIRMSSGISALDDMLADGYWPGASTLIAGPSGSGKTLMGLHFVMTGARQGQPGVIATLQENPTQLQRVLAGFGWSLHEPNVEVMYRSPVDIYIDEWVHDLLGAIERTGARRVLIDSLADVRMAAGDEIRFREFVYSIVQRFSRQAVSVLMTMEIQALFGTDRITDAAVSPLADNVVMLGYKRDRDTTSRTIAVIKTRASRHDPGVRTFVIGSDGISLDQPAPSTPPGVSGSAGIEDPLA